MTREEFEAILALDGQFELVKEESAYNGKDGKWWYAGLQARGGGGRCWGTHSTTYDEAVNKLIEDWEKGIPEYEDH